LNEVKVYLFVQGEASNVKIVIILYRVHQKICKFPSKAANRTTAPKWPQPNEKTKKPETNSK